MTARAAAIPVETVSAPAGGAGARAPDYLPIPEGLRMLARILGRQAAREFLAQEHPPRTE